MQPNRIVDHVPALIAAICVAAVAWVQPVETTQADAGSALVAAQALAQHGSLDLTVFRSDPRLIYDLDADYRIFKHGAQRRYFSVGVPVLSAPAVWLANRLGYDMLRPADEAALQNLLSALCCGAVLLLLYILARSFLAPVPSLLIALVFALGSPLISTLATALWSLDYSIPLLLLCLILVVRFERAPRLESRPLWLVAGILLALAILCRPASALIVPALMLYVFDRHGVSRLRLGALAAIGAGGLFALDRMPYAVLPTYYAPQRLLGNFDLLDGIPTILLAPSRGLLVFCPFLMPLLAAAWWQRRNLFRHRLAWLAAVWIALQVIAVGTKGKWWGGHSFGPRLLTEVIVAAFLLALLLLAESFRGRRATVVAGAVLALPAVAAHSGQALFNDATWRFNDHPPVDLASEALLDWRTPQFLANDAMLERRSVDWQRRELMALAPGATLSAGDRTGVFEGWWPIEPDRRWSKGGDSSICFIPRGVARNRVFSIVLSVRVAHRQRLAVALDDQDVGVFDLAPGSLATIGIPATGQRLGAPGERCLRFSADAPHTASAADPRQIAIAFHQLTLQPLPAGAIVTYADDVAFLTGWSVAEDGFRWSDGPQARLALDVAEPRSAAAWNLIVEGRAFGAQRMRVRLADGPVLGDAEIGTLRATMHFAMPAAWRPASRLVVLVLDFPDARAPGGSDQRRLGLALEAIRLTATARP